MGGSVYLASCIKLKKKKTKTASKINARKGKRKNSQDVCYFPNEIDEILRSF